MDKRPNNANRAEERLIKLLNDIRVHKAAAGALPEELKEESGDKLETEPQDFADCTKKASLDMQQLVNFNYPQIRDAQECRDGYFRQFPMADSPLDSIFFAICFLLVTVVLAIYLFK